MRIFYDHQAFSLQDAGGVSRYQYELIAMQANATCRARATFRWNC